MARTASSSTAKTPVDKSGHSVAAAGDVNGDGFGDVIVGAAGADPHGSGSGSSYVVFGKSSGFDSMIELSGLNGSTGFRIDGVTAFDESGHSVASAGDVNGDGLGDVFVGAPGAGPNGIGSGASYVVFGKATVFAPVFELSELSPASGFRINGELPGDTSGFTVAAAGDVNGDGFGDVIAGAHSASPSGAGSGAGHVVFGNGSGFTSVIEPLLLDGNAGFQISGETSADNTGLPVAAAGDVNGDGFGDIILGAHGADINGNSSGASYVVFGRPPNVSVARNGSAASQAISGGAFTDLIVGFGGNDVLEGRGSNDFISGSAGSHTASYRHSPLAVTASLLTPSVNTNDARGDIYFAIRNLEGSAFADKLSGDGKANILTGGRGKDSLKGGSGKDTFGYRFANESLPSDRDVIADFNPGTASSAVDKIDLSVIDAKTAIGGNQAFTFRGTKAFNSAGQIRMKISGVNIILQGNTGGTTAPEFEIVLKGLAKKVGAITAKDFKL